MSDKKRPLKAKRSSTTSKASTIKKLPVKRKMPIKLSSGKSTVEAKKTKLTENSFASTAKVAPSQNWSAFMAKTGTGVRKTPSTKQSEQVKSKPIIQNKPSQPEVTEIIGIDCEMVGAGENGRENLLARVSLVNSNGETLYDTFVKPINDIPVTDYRTKYSGVRPSDLVNAENYEVAQKKVADLIRDKILVGHDLKNDFQVLYLKHPRKRIRDTAKFKPFRAYSSRTPSLKVLADKILDWRIQDGEHNSVVDAKASMALYVLHRAEWEKSLKKNEKNVQNRPNRKSRPLQHR